MNHNSKIIDGLKCFEFLYYEIMDFVQLYLEDSDIYSELTFDKFTVVADDKSQQHKSTSVEYLRNKSKK